MTARGIPPLTEAQNPDRSASVSRRALLLGAPSLVFATLLQAGHATEPWFELCPSVAQVGSFEDAVRAHARMVIFNAAADPSWGPYGQRLALLDTARDLAQLKAAGFRVLTYIEGFGDCAVYAVALERHADGSWELRSDDAATPAALRTHWCWAAPELRRGNALRWVGLHACAQEQDYLRPGFTLSGMRIRPPTYPDGRPATGRLAGRPEPLDAELWDACAAKDVNGLVVPICAPAIGIKPGEDPPEGLGAGLYRAVAGTDDIEAHGIPAGAPVWCGHLSFHKDLSAPFWRHCAEASAEAIGRAGVDGVWCDNWSPWDNFGYPPVKRAFGDWSVAGFRRYCREPAIRAEIRRATGSEPGAIDVRRWFLGRAESLGARRASNLDDPAWSDPRWVEDPVWRHYKAARQAMARKDLRAFHMALHRGALRGGKRGFLVCGNDVPFYGLGWAREPWTDMVHTEVTPGWHMGSGSRGIMLPPKGKMAVVYRAALAHQRRSYAGAWYYVDPPHQRKETLGKVLCAEAFANGSFLLCDPENARVSGTVGGHAWWNRFVRSHEAHFVGRSAVADIGLVFSPDSQLALLTPGGFPDLDRQPHVFGHWGWGTFLLDAHMPYRVIPDWRLTEAGLRGLGTLVLPDVECLEDLQIGAVLDWVRRGGRLVLSGGCGLRRGAPGAFARRAAPPFATLGLETGPGLVTRRYGAGVAIAADEQIGMRYYLDSEHRESLRPIMSQMVGSSDVVRSVSAPDTIEVAVWRSRDRTCLFVDLANTSISLAEDRLHRSGPLTFEVRSRWPGAVARIITPEGTTDARVEQRGPWSLVSVPGVDHFASVMLTPR